jgi:hypothetical protein
LLGDAELCFDGLVDGDLDGDLLGYSMAIRLQLDGTLMVTRVRINIPTD